MDRSIRFPCGVCSQKCLEGSIHCDACKTWFHSRCDQLSDADMVEMGESDLTYICARCCLGYDGTFDYEASLLYRRANSAISQAKRCGLSDGADSSLLPTSKMTTDGLVLSANDNCRLKHSTVPPLIPLMET